MNHFHESAEALMKEIVTEYIGDPAKREHFRTVESINAFKLQTYLELRVRAEELDKLNRERLVEVMSQAVGAFHPDPKPTFDESEFKGVYHCLAGDEHRHIRAGISRITLCELQISKTNNRGVDMSYPVCMACIEVYNDDPRRAC